MIALDHVSVRDVPAGFERTGHRVMLDHAYIEVGHEGEPLLFLRPEEDPDSARFGGGGASAIEAAARLLGREPRPYSGRDGEWLDLDLAGPVALTRRIDRDDWPPAGAGRLEVRVRGDAAALLDPLEVLGGPPRGLLVDHAPGEPLRVVQVIAGGVQVL
ncbi:MAG TPA: hypothetical protein VGW10_03105 [Solirubrobacteraceae bacterium]|nr:hypothetical protein [Solirubrobacteraceae bacterium]